MFRPHGFDHFSWLLASRWSRYLPTFDEKDPRQVQFRVESDRMQPSEFVWEPYLTPDVALVAHPAIFEQRHAQLWTARVPLIYYGTIKWHQVDRVIPQFGGVHDIPGLPLNIDFLHSKDGRGGDRWFPATYQTWHGDWDSREEHVIVIDRVPDPGPSDLYLRWWFMAGKRFLSGDAAHADHRMTQVP
ncbi:hypothetical protein PIB30_091088 [Stylosanthes scabra]|uniref:Aminotransferase-like plant mobile domain-containing protein n=1 Tax=Stylosanthes scabra TaxID=79078 RepID=A0ABU6SVF5_9FABA|nr:hypothetical protein [Stylosanthes scabra]